MSDGLVEIVLAREWCGHEPHSTVRVDPVRATQMRAEGYEEQPELEADAEAKPTRRRRSN